MIKLNDYLVHFQVPDRVTATKIACKEFINVLEDGVPYQWKLEFGKEGFDSSFSRLKEFLGVCVRLEESELQKPLKKKIAHAIKEHENLDKRRKLLKKPKLHHKRRHGSGKHHQSKCKNFFVTIMAFVTMTWMSATLLKLAGSTFSPCTISQNIRGSGRSEL
eukprot:5116490-Ditylum_brightwellii.AAC.1